MKWIRRATVAWVAWTAVAALFALPSLVGEGAQRSIVLASLAQWWSWALVAPLILAVDRRLPFNGRQLWQRALVHVFLGFVFTAFYVYVMEAVRAALGIGSWTTLADVRPLMRALRGMFLWSWLVYLLIVGGWQAYRYYERYRLGELQMERLERQYSEARLNALRAQLDPHFLFNALNTISSQVERDPRLAREMIGHLGDLLRLSLDSRDKRLVTLEEELVFLDHYVAIQRIRFGDKLRVEVSAGPEARSALVPGLLLQPLVENAIRHGFSRRPSGGKVTIEARCAQGALEIAVLDDGAGLPSDWDLTRSSGVGLSATRERVLASPPAGAGRFEIGPREGGGTAVRMVLPLVDAKTAAA
ncbi:sensor histidine kinase [Opitutaceae bacterium EW11]|nr:sensor histidine kinase [Opitutaceae bacterium EW11]